MIIQHINKAIDLENLLPVLPSQFSGKLYKAPVLKQSSTVADKKKCRRLFAVLLRAAADFNSGSRYRQKREKKEKRRNVNWIRVLVSNTVRRSVDLLYYIYLRS